MKGQFASKADSKIIIFTQYRDTIESIVETLAKDGVPAQRFVGQANKTDSEGMDQKKQTDVLEKFTEGEFKVLVSSSIGEEGLHVPDVDLVVFYEAVPSEIRAIQRKGRTGRTMRGKVIVLLAEGTVDEAYFYSSLRREKFMKSMVSAPKGEVKKPAKRGIRRARRRSWTTWSSELRYLYASNSLPRTVEAILSSIISSVPS